jgi:hypothetical protein
MAVVLENNFEFIKADKLIMIYIVLMEEVFWNWWLTIVFLTNDFIAVELDEFFWAELIVGVQVIHLE